MVNDCLYIVMPAYNEAENIEEVVRDWYPQLEMAGEGSRLCVFNDASKDETLEILQGLQEEFPQLVAVDKPNTGHGATLLTAYRYALDHGADYVFQTDSDGQTLPEEFPAFWADRERQAFYVGLRARREDGFSRKIVTTVLRTVVRLIFKISLPDANAPYRLMERDALEECLRTIPEGFFLSNVLLLVTACYRGDEVRYREIVFRPRQGGVNSINLKRILHIGRESLKKFREAKQVLDRVYHEPKIKRVSRP